MGKGGIAMPVISRFYGIIIRMYFLQSEHNPPHIHAIYGEDVAALEIQTGNIIEGYLHQRDSYPNCPFSHVKISENARKWLEY